MGVGGAAAAVCRGWVGVVEVGQKLHVLAAAVLHGTELLRSNDV